MGDRVTVILRLIEPSEFVHVYRVAD